MNTIDIVLALIIAAIVTLAIKKIRKTKGCECGCNACNRSCMMKNVKKVER